MYYHVTGVADYRNKGLITVSKSKYSGETYHGVKVPPETRQYTRIDVQKGYNYFLYLGPNKTRHIAIWNINPQMNGLPNFFLNWVMSNVLYTNMTNLQKFSKNLQDPTLQPDIYRIY